MDFVRRFFGRALSGVALLTLVGCGRAGNSPGSMVAITVSLPSSTILVPQDGTAAALNVNITSTSETALVSVNGLPGGVQVKYAATDTNPSGLLTFVASESSPAGTYTPTISVSSAGQTASVPFTLVVAVVATVSKVVDTTLGVNGKLKQPMSTSFQVAEWNQGYFATSAAAREAMVANLTPQHIRLQPVSQAIPMKANSGAASDWDFTLLDQTVQPVLALGDHSPEFQIAIAPTWMLDSHGDLDVTNHLGDFAAYAANLVRYYNKGGFDAGGTHFQSPGTTPITWWGVFNEPDFNGITPSQYVAIYNAVVPAMLAVDPSIKLVALEFSGSTLGTGYPDDPQLYLPPFFATANAGGVNAQMDAVAMHFYGACDQLKTDAEMFDAVPQYVAVESYIEQLVKTRSDLALVPVWLTENNVDADYADSNGMSNCNPAQVFVPDPRGTSAYFAAWRPYVFSQFGKAGNQALYQWTHLGDTQYGEVDANGNAYLSYWVDKTLANFYPSATASPGPDLLSLAITDSSSIEVLATRNTNGTVVVMVVDRAVLSSTDDNGGGAPRTVVIDTSGVGSFSAASLLTVDAMTNLTNGPAGVSVTTASRISFALSGYGVAFLTLTP